MGNDPVWNTPEPVEIYGQQFTVKELPAGRLRLYIREVMAIIGRAAGEQDSTEAGLVMIEESGDQIVALMSESTGIPTAELDELPGRVFMRLMDEVIKANEAMVADFLAVKNRVDSLTAPFKKEKRNGAMGQPNSLASLSGKDSSVGTSLKE